MRIFGSLRCSFCFLMALAACSSAQDTNFPVGPQYLVTPGVSPLFLQPVATPSLSFDSGLPQPSPVTDVTAKADEETVEVVSSVLEAQRQTSFPSIYYGVPRASVVQIALGEAAPAESAPLPASILEAGVVEVITAQGLRERGYSLTLAEAAARWKSHTGRARRVFTNDDLERLRPRD